MKRVAISLVSISVLLLLAALPVEGQRLLVSLGGIDPDSDDAGAIAEVDLATGDFTILATPVPGRGLDGLAALPDGRLFATTYANSDIESSLLLELDPETGALLRTVAELEIEGMFLDVHDLATDPLTGALYGFSFERSNILMRLDPEDGTVTEIGRPDFGPTPPGGFLPLAALAFASDGTPWAMRGSDPSVWELDLQLPDLVANNYPGTPALVGARGLTIHPVTSEFFFASCCASSTEAGLYTKQPPDFHGTLFASAGGTRRITDVAFVGGPGPVVAIPTLSPWALLLLAALLATAALAMNYRRREGDSPG